MNPLRLGVRTPLGLEIRDITHATQERYVSNICVYVCVSRSRATRVESPRVSVPRVIAKATHYRNRGARKYREELRTVPMSQSHGKTVASWWSPLPKGNGARRSVKTCLRKESKTLEDKEQRCGAEIAARDVYRAEHVCVA